MAFTAEELAEMRRADEEIEASFRIGREEIEQSRELDREAELDEMNHAHRLLKKYQRQYYEANREKIAEYQRQYREANREKIAEAQRQYREANREKIAEAQRQYREANKENIAEGKQELRALRKRLGLSQQRFGELFGVTQVTVSNWERITAPENWRDLISNVTGE